MSLINQMLRDLDRRQDRTDGPGAVPPAYRQGRPPRRSPWLILAFAASVPLAALVVWLAWEQFAAQPAAATASSPAPAPARVAAAESPARLASPAEPAAAPPPVEPERREPKPEPPPRPVSSKPSPPPSAPPARPAKAAEPSPPPEEETPGTVHKSVRPVTPLQRAEEHYRRAYTLLSQGRQAQGEAALRQALAAAPGHEKARELLALVLIRGGRFVEAGELLREGLQRNPGNRQLVRIYAQVLDRQQRTAASVRLLEQHRPAQVSRDPAYFALLAAFYRKQGRHADAAALYRELTRVRPDNGVWWIGLGLSLEALDQPDAAADAFRKARDTGSLNAALRRFVNARLAATDAPAD